MSLGRSGHHHLQVSQDCGIVALALVLHELGDVASWIVQHQLLEFGHVDLVDRDFCHVEGWERIQRRKQGGCASLPYYCIYLDLLDPSDPIVGRLGPCEPFSSCSHLGCM
eukprot:TRINITY_DN50338_c0_g4_i1.p2 TRINITY_DN50338_c0_g4~~TRINITY_DN50338_c0_g4_i1.p2  ORF type:complete len:110 (-),score=5.78 TRINITY_DN50338_c0_g4_i1:79-408(-)